MSPPNILFISVDSLRSDFCSFLTEKKPTTPNLEDLAKQSTIYSKAVSPSCWTLPAHGSVFTGLYPTEHQVKGEKTSLGDHKTLGELIANLGYQTKSFGYNGWLETGDILRGFDHTVTKKTTKTRIQQNMRRGRRLLFRHQLRDEITIKNIRNEIRDNSDPFCYFLHFNDVHYIYNPTYPYYRPFSSISLPNLSLNILKQKKLFQDNKYKMYTGQSDLSESDITIMKDLYRGSIRQIDDLIGKVLDDLSSIGELDNTIIIVFGDHGDNFGEQGLFGHQFSLSDSLIRVPLLIYDPTDQLPEGKETGIVQLNDIYPTILSLLEIDIPETRSVDLTRTTRDSAYVYYRAPDSLIDRITSETTRETVAKLPPQTQYCIWKSTDEKLIYYPETESWGGRSKGDRELENLLKSHQESLIPIPTQEGTPVSETVIDNLKQMGYM